MAGREPQRAKDQINDGDSKNDERQRPRHGSFKEVSLRIAKIRCDTGRTVAESKQRRG